MKRKRNFKFSFDVLIAHGKNCPYCNELMKIPYENAGKNVSYTSNFPTRDHIIPKSKMPGMGYIFVCRKCNLDKSDLTLEQWYNKLKEIGDVRVPLIKKWMKDNARFKYDGALMK